MKMDEYKALIFEIQKWLRRLQLEDRVVLDKIICELINDIIRDINYELQRIEK